MAAVHLCKRSLFIKVLPKICISLKANLCVRKPFVCIHRWIISLGVFDSLLLMWCWWWQHRSSKVHNTSSHIHLNTHHIYYILTRNFRVQVHSAAILAWGIVGDCKQLAKKVQFKCFLNHCIMVSPYNAQGLHNCTIDVKQWLLMRERFTA